jgi:hypothetical protein
MRRCGQMLGPLHSGSADSHGGADFGAPRGQVAWPTQDLAAIVSGTKRLIIQMCNKN